MTFLVVFLLCGSPTHFLGIHNEHARFIHYTETHLHKQFFNYVIENPTIPPVGIEYGGIAGCHKI